MKKLLSLVLIVLVLLTAMPFGMISVSADVGDNYFCETEPNDSILTSNFLYSDYTISGSLEADKYDMDFFEFTVYSTTQVAIFCVSDDSSLLMGLMDSTEEIISVATEDYTDGGLPADTIIETVSAGTYYIVLLDEDSYGINEYVFYIEYEDSYHTHNYSVSSIVAPTCVSKGYTNYTCYCGDSYSDNYVSISEHTYGNYTSVGSTQHKRVCSFCGKTETLNHVYDDKFDIYCNKCNKKREDIIVGAVSGYYTYIASNGEAKITEVATSISGDVVIPSTLGGNVVTHIGENAFSGCSKITGITIPYDVTNIDKNAFLGCVNLEKVNTPSFNAWCKIEFENYASNPLYYAGNYYLNGKIVRNLVIPNTVSQIKNLAFFCCDSITNVTIPSSVKSIGSKAFESCDNLKTVTIPASVTKIGASAFGYCDAITDIYFGDNYSKWSSLISTVTNNTALIKAKVSCTGLTKNGNGRWCYIKYGKVDYNKNGLVKHEDNIWYYVNNGMVDFSYTGLVKHSGSWYYVSKGKMNASYTGLVKHSGSWYYVSNGKMNASYTGLVKHSGSWYYVSKGKMNTSYTGLVKHSGSWYYVSKGKMNASYTGLVKHSGSWYFVSKGKMNASYTGLVKHSGSWYYVSNGKVNFSYSGKVLFNGTYYAVKNGVKV